MLIRRVKFGLTSAAGKLGYLIINKKYLPFGWYPWLDVRRMADDLRCSIQIVFDVGANVGDVSKDLLKQFTDCRVYGFEPYPLTYGKLKNNVSSERFFPVQLALSDSCGQLPFYEYGGPNPINSLAANARCPTRLDLHPTQIFVKTNTLDNYCAENNISKIDLIKIDTEGFEFNVLRGAEKMLQRRAIKFIYLEFNDFEPRRGAVGGSLSEIAAYLAKFGYRFVATYTDYIETDGEFFAVANALLVNDARRAADELVLLRDEAAA